jgi:CBS domain-containing protein
MTKLINDPSCPIVRLGDLAHTEPVVAHADEPLRVVVYRMAESGFTRFPVVDHRARRKLLGMVSLEDLLTARAKNLTEERQREQVLQIRLPFRIRTERITTSQ